MIIEALVTNLPLHYPHWWKITKGNTYKVIYDGLVKYTFLDDNGCKVWIHKTYFKKCKKVNPVRSTGLVSQLRQRPYNSVRFTADLIKLFFSLIAMLFLVGLVSFTGILLVWITFRLYPIAGFYYTAGTYVILITLLWVWVTNRSANARP